MRLVSRPTMYVVIALCLGTATALAEWNRGPVLIGGDDMDYHFSVGMGGQYYMREGFTFLGAHVTNTKTKAVCLGCKDGQATTAFNTAFDASALYGVWTRATVSGVTGIYEFFTNTGAVKIADAGLIYLPSSGADDYGQVVGGITQPELDKINQYRGVLKAFVDGGGGLFTHTLQGLDQEHGWDWLHTLVPSIQVVNMGAWGLTTDLNLTCTATSFFFPDLTPQQIDLIRDAVPWHTAFEPGPGEKSPGGVNGRRSAAPLGSPVHAFGPPEDPAPYIWGRVKLATILVKVNDTLEPGTYEISGADGLFYSNGQTFSSTPGPGTVTLTVPQQ